MIRQNGLNTIEDRGFCRRYSLQELFTVKLQKRNLVFILPFGIKNFGRPRTAHKPPAQQAFACTRNRRHRRGGRIFGTKCTTIFAARLFVVEQVIDRRVSVSPERRALGKKRYVHYQRVQAVHSLCLSKTGSTRSTHTTLSNHEK